VGDFLAEKEMRSLGDCGTFDTHFPMHFEVSMPPQRKGGERGRGGKKWKGR